MTFGLKKEERIYKRDEIQLLFKQGKPFVCYPYKVISTTYQPAEESQVTLKFAVSVPKRLFKKATDRNLLKRRTREAYRLNRLDLKSSLNNKKTIVLFMLIYIGKEAETYAVIEKKIILILQQLQKKYAKNNK